MYEEFFNLKEKPFDLTPNQRYLYLSDGHKEALSLLSYGVVERKGFVLLTGDVGTGKTTVIQALLGNLDKRVEYVHISNPLLTRDEFIQYLAFSTFKKRVHFRSKADFLLEFEAYLNECLQHQKIFILLVDEAQSLSYELMEEIRLLSNMESSEEKLINIFLVGQPELNEKLQNPVCKPLRQRISNRFHLPPLDLKATREYMASRLKVAGAEDLGDIFDKKAVETIYQCTQGVPRLINVLADNALLLGYSTGKKKITADMVRESFKDMNPPEPRAKEKTAPEEETPAPESGRETVEKPPARKRRRFWKWAAAFLFMLAVLYALYLLDPRAREFAMKIGHELGNRGPLIKEEIPVDPPTPAPESKGELSSEGAVVFETAKTARGSEAATALPNPPVKTRETAAAPPGATQTAPQREPAPPPRPEPRADLRVEDPKIELKGDSPEVVENVDQSQWKKVRVRVGDTLAKLAMEHYGRADGEILGRIKEQNPHIRNINMIDVGQTISFPPLTSDPLAGSFTIHVASYKPLRVAQEKFSTLLANDYEAYLIPVIIPSKGTLYRITIGNFPSMEKAEAYASELLKKPEFEYARVVAVEMN